MKITYSSLYFKGKTLISFHFNEKELTLFRNFFDLYKSLDAYKLKLTISELRDYFYKSERRIAEATTTDKVMFFKLLLGDIDDNFDRLDFIACNWTEPFYANINHDRYGAYLNLGSDYVYFINYIKKFDFVHITADTSTVGTIITEISELMRKWVKLTKVLSIFFDVKNILKIFDGLYGNKRFDSYASMQRELITVLNYTIHRVEPDGLYIKWENIMDIVYDVHPINDFKFYYDFTRYLEDIHGYYGNKKVELPKIKTLNRYGKIMIDRSR